MATLEVDVNRRSANSIQLRKNPASLGKFDKSVSLLTWAYNEEELVSEFLERAVALLEANVEDWEIIFVNDGSTDRTGEILSSYAAQDPRIVVINNECNVNVGQSCKRAIKAANKEYLFWQTVDWSYDLKNIRIFLELLNHYDVVQGIRPTPIRLLSYVPLLRSVYRASKRSDNFKKAIVSLSNYYVLRILFGVTFQDFQNITFYPSKLIQSVDLKGDSSFLNPECLLRTYEKGASFIEVPIPFIPRTAGEAKGTKLTSILRSIGDISGSWLKWGWQYNWRIKKNKEKRIYRIAEPFHLEPQIVAMSAPLFREYR